MKQNNEYIEIDKIKEYKYNQKKHTEKQIKNIIKSIEKYGQTQPIIIDKKNVIVAGHGRYEALKRIGVKDVWVKKLKNLTEQQINEYRILDNKLNESEWDLDLLYKDEKAIENILKDFDIEFEKVIKEDIEIKEEKLKPYRKTHYLISIDIADNNKVIPKIEEIKKIKGVEVYEQAN